jgi:hypothetical protein
MTVQSEIFFDSSAFAGWQKMAQSSLIMPYIFGLGYAQQLIGLLSPTCSSRVTGTDWTVDADSFMEGMDIIIGGYGMDSDDEDLPTKVTAPVTPLKARAATR